MTTGPDPFEGWQQADVGCHWSRPLPDGREAYLSTWAYAGRSGYSLTVNFVSCRFPGLEEAKAAFDFLAASTARDIQDAPGALSSIA